MTTLRLAGVALSLLLVTLTGLDARADDPPGEAVYAVVLNGELVSSGTLLLQRADGSLLAEQGDIRRWRLTVPAEPTLTYHGRKYYALTALAGAKVRIDTSKQQVSITVPPQVFEPTAIAVRPVVAALPTRDRGAFVNYQLYGQSSNFHQNFVNALLSSGITSGQGVLLSSVLASGGPATSGVLRLESVWRHDDPIRLSTFLIGDAISQPGALGGAVRFGGVQLASNFGIDPTLITFAAPTLSGQTALPSTVSVYVNNVQAASQAVPPGPFSITNFPVVTGAGQVELQVRDVLGHVVSVTQPYYASPALLKRGLDAFSYEAGFQRQQYALQSNNYGPLIVAATHRYGLTDRFTTEYHAEYTSRQGLVAATGRWLAGSLGTIGVNVAASGSPSGAGNAGQLEYAYMRSGFNLTARFEGNSLNYKTLATSQSAQPIGQVQIQIGSMIGQHLFVNATYTEERTVQTGVNRISALGATLSLPHGTIAFNTIRDVAATSTSEAQITYSVPIDSLRLLTSSTRFRPAAFSSTTELSQHLPDSGIGFAVRADNSIGSNAGSALSVTQQDDSGTRTVDLSHFGGFQTNSATVAGAMSFFGHKAFFSRMVSDGYGLARLPGYPGVRVYVNNVQEGTTDHFGEVVLPDLLSYQPNAISIRASDLPLTANVENARVTVTPFARSAVIVNFPTAPAGGVLFSIVSEDGRFLPPGSLVAIGEKSWPVADDGAVYIPNLAMGEHELVVARKNATCKLKLTIPADTRTIPDLGRFVCKSGGH